MYEKCFIFSLLISILHILSSKNPMEHLGFLNSCQSPILDYWVTDGSQKLSELVSETQIFQPTLTEAKMSEALKD